MKLNKLFLLGIAATTMFASCSNDETVEAPKGNAIGFANAFVNNGTRATDPSLTTATIANFAVYGFTNEGQIFNGTEVTKSGSDWIYNPLQYWVGGNTYTFGAIAPAAQSANVSNVAVADGFIGMNIAFTNNGTVDLLHAAPAQIPTVAASYSAPVELTFNHQLSKVKFSFENGLTTGYSIKVSNIEITNAYNSGTLTVAKGGNTWVGNEESLLLKFGDVVDAEGKTATFDNTVTGLESANELLLIPSPESKSYNITFSIQLYKGDVLMGTYSHTATLSNQAFLLGYCYDLKATIDHKNIDPEGEQNPIQFTVTAVSDWTQGGEITIK